VSFTWGEVFSSHHDSTIVPLSSLYATTLTRQISHFSKLGAIPFAIGVIFQLGKF
jgi:hypothetical protein